MIADDWKEVYDMNREVTSEKVKQTTRGTKTVEENCGNCSYREGWFCYVAGDYVKREGHCSEHERQRK